MSQKLPYTIHKTDSAAFRLIPLSDVHIGAKSCDYPRLKRTIAYALETGAYILPMGDWVNNNQIHGKASPWDDHCDPHEQLELMLDLFRPVKEAGLFIDFWIEGNHGARSKKASGLSMGKLQAQGLGLKYVGPNGAVKIVQPKSSWTIFATHGSKGGNPRNCLRHYASLMPTADIVLAGHIHQFDNFVEQVFTMTNSGVGCQDRWHFTTGSMQRWEGYARAANYQPTPTGCWELILHQRPNGKGQKRLESKWLAL